MTRSKVIESPGVGDNDIAYFSLNSYVLQSAKLHYVSTPKVACTVLKWWFARLHGLDIHACDTRRSWETEPELVIHDLLPQICPAIAGLPVEEMRNILESEEYFRFAVVRNPFKRVFSAWQSKLLLREPFQITPYLDKDFFNRPIKDLKDIGISFEGFLEYVAEHEWPEIPNPHWAPQAQVLRLDKVKYSQIAQIENAGSLWERIAEHLGRCDFERPLKRRTNESLIPYHTKFFSERSQELIQKLYAGDFDSFGYSRTLPPALEPFDKRQMEMALKAINMIRGRNHRFGEVRLLLEQSDNQAAYLTRLAIDRDLEINGLKEAACDHFAQIESLSQFVSLREEEIAVLNAWSKKQAEHIGALEENLASSEAEKTVLREELASRESEKFRLVSDLESVLKSIS